MGIKNRRRIEKPRQNLFALIISKRHDRALEGFIDVVWISNDAGTKGFAVTHRGWRSAANPSKIADAYVAL